MIVDTSTVRLIIFVGMFLAFAGDYSFLLEAIFGKPSQNSTQPSDGPVGPATGHPKILQDEWRKDVEKETAATRKAKMMATIKTACLPKLICELTATENPDQLSEMERSLLNLIRDTSLSSTAELPSRYHFAAHMGQLIAGVEGQGCHNFFPGCPLPGASVLHMMKKVRLH